ncbi:acyl-CoA dehydrogenase family protein [Zavarzinia compransoris]|uniref:Acyl-[acyl-carrier-protein] dehydrogenase MbtN n=1 Tax=Zavarzinia compransoris TaxID=1264899 RepID=A0A317E3I5_9PROT|nr:acyl-CoA dehydrogenase family protein [Zavarzinia compransoris]PWR20944.1 acyl-CoA dehydrogenase [Zavarzinia compransoris]TDP43972.1 alkylation response protein AidB-like acyl-CoA dehydrogenase [Zavarzinia compransoris]
MIERTLFKEEHNIFRDSVRRFMEKEVVPYHAQWEKDGIVPRDLWLKAGEAGLLCCTVPEEYGGLGLDYLFDVVVFEELWRVGASGPGFLIHTDLVATYILSFGTEEQKRHWLPKMVKGEAIGSLGMTEPHAGSDLKAIRTRATRDGDDFLINGQKVFISNGQMCDVIVLATKTDSAAGAKGITLFLVDTHTEGFRRGRNLDKLGMHAQDTSELFFDNVRVPASAILGQEGRGFQQMMTKLSQERLAQAVRSATVTETVIGWTADYTADRKAFGQTVADFQNTQFKLAELQAEAITARVLTDKCIELFMAGKLDPVDAAVAKMITANLHCKAVDECLQLHGGWGYMWEYPICRAYADARIIKIAGGSIEVMKMIIARDLFATRKGPRAQAAE